MQPRDPISELHDTRLYQLLFTIDREYADRITRFVNGIAPILANTQRHFPYYTRHDAHHGFRVVRRIEQVLDPSCLELVAQDRLNPAELFLLIGAAYAHDLGMTIFPGETDELLGSLHLKQATGWEISPVLQTYLRREHSKRGGEYIRLNAEALGVPVNLVSALDTMMRSHNLAISELGFLDAVHAAIERPLDVRQLAAIVCTGDALEFSDTRVMDGVLDHLKIDPSDSARVSYRENMKHIGIGDSLAISDDGRVIVAGAFAEAEVLALAHRTLDQMEEWIQGYCDIDQRSRRRRLRISAEPFLRNLSFAGGRFERLGVRLNKRSVIDLIASNAVWKTNTGIAIRELVQNAVEACRYRAHHAAPADRYAPTVRVEFDRAQRTVRVIDNGCGMSERTVLNNFLTVGSSRSKEAGYVDAEYAPIARFGIGFWSVFVIAREARIETAEFEPYRGRPESAAHASGIAFEVSLGELKDYTVFKPIIRPCGTMVNLTLSDDTAIDEVYARALTMLHCPEIPVTLVLDGEESTIARAVPAVSDADILGNRSRIKDELGVQLFHWQGSIGESELSLGLAYRMVDGKATFLADPTSSLMTALGGIRSPSTSVCGFSVPVRPKALCLDLLRVGSFRANHSTPRGFEFGLDRQQLLQNKASQRFARDIAGLIHAGYRAFLDATNSRDPATIAALREQSEMHGGNVFDTFTGSELVDAAKHYPDLLCFRLFPVTPDSTLDQIKPVHINLTELRRLTGTIFTLQTRVDLRLQGARFISFDTESQQAVWTVCEAVRNWMNTGKVSSPAYVIEANRAASMLFDADPESSVEFFSQHPFGHLCVQAINLERLSFDAAAANVLGEVRGRWTGAIYLRTFTAPGKKPYVFLGRHRILIERSSRLAQHLGELHSSGKEMRLTDTLALLKEDEQGFTAESIKNLL